MEKLTEICYLCGERLCDPISRDHVPPQQFYSDEIRRQHNPHLLTIPVHKACNSSFQHDEDYFVNSLLPLGCGSYAGNSLLHEISQKYRKGEKVKIVHKVLREFERRPSGLILPPNKVAKRIEGDRIHRVAWKIVRGLYFHNFQEVLPADTPNAFEIVPPDELPPPAFFALLDEPVRGRYPGVFDDKFAKFPEVQNFNYWAMLLWDRLLIISMFHDPSCDCDDCTTRKVSRLFGHGT
jgi:hypothetical protein